MPKPRDQERLAAPAREGQVTRTPRSAAGRALQPAVVSRDFRPYRHREPRRSPRAGVANPPVDCPFCDRITAGLFDIDLGRVAAFTPLNPVTPGHLLVVPVQHVADAVEDPRVTGLVMAAAATLARRHKSVNLITSVGPAATQTIRHLHIHLVPRHADDGLTLPWTGQDKQKAAC
jgi:histidine triad (HIT) family protein